MGRRGELCPPCKIGHLRPTGQTEWDKTHKGSSREARGYRCDNPDCANFHGQASSEIGISVTAGATGKAKKKKK
jgi:hypothetical protein